MKNTYYKIFKSRKVKENRLKVKRNAHTLLTPEAQKDKRAVNNLHIVINNLPPKEIIFLGQLIETHEIMDDPEAKKALSQTFRNRIIKHSSQYRSGFDQSGIDCQPGRYSS